MEEFNSLAFTSFIAFLGALDGGSFISKATNSKELREKVTDEICTSRTEECRILLGEFQKLNLPMSKKTMEKMIEVLSSGCTLEEYCELAKDLRGRLVDELSLRKLFFIEPNKVNFLDINLFGEKVSSAFPSTIYDIEEAGKCIAFERWTSAVFHLSRIAEIATVTIGERVGYQSKKPGFGEVLSYMDAQLEKARRDRNNAKPEFVGSIQPLSAITAQMHVVNNAWRQRVAHLDSKYTEQEAIRIWWATKGLMEEIASQSITEKI